MTDDNLTIELTLSELRAVTGYAAACAREALMIFEAECPGDLRPRTAINMAQAFGDGANRTKALRDSAWDAHRAAGESRDAGAAAASEAARSALTAAGAAFLHPLAKATQVKHILGSAAHAARALEISAGDDREVGKARVEMTLFGDLPMVREVLRRYALLVAVFPLGVVLALARSSKLPAIQIIATIFIEAIRGVPLVSILFMASVMLPLFMPDGITVDKLLRAQVAIVIFAGAYIAETVRGGLQAIPKGQHEAAAALGLGYWLSMRKIALPQALKIVIPPLVNIFIGFFQDTTLVTIIGLLDFLDTVRASIRDPNWQGIAVMEGYVFATLTYAVFSSGMGSYSRFLERRFKTDHNRAPAL